MIAEEIRKLIEIVKQQQSAIEEHQVVIGMLIALLEKNGVTDYHEMNGYLGQLREQWPRDLPKGANLFDFLLENRQDPNGQDDPNRPHWLRGIIQGGRADENGDQPPE